MILTLFKNTMNLKEREREKTIFLSNVHYMAKGKPFLADWRKLAVGFKITLSSEVGCVPLRFPHQGGPLREDFSCRRGFVKFFGITYYFLQANHMSENLNLKMTQVTCTPSSSFSKGPFCLSVSCVLLIAIFL